MYCHLLAITAIIDVEVSFPQSYIENPRYNKIQASDIEKLSLISKVSLHGWLICKKHSVHKKKISNLYYIEGCLYLNTP